MILHLPQTIFKRFSSHLEKFWNSGNTWLVSAQVGVVAYLTALFVSFPGTLLHREFYTTRLADSLKLSENLFARDLVEDITAYRITVPVLLKILHIGSPVLVVLLFQVLPSMATLALLFFNASKRLGPRLAWPVTLMFALSMLLFFTFYYGGLFDSFSHFCLAVVMTTANPLVTAVAALAGVLNDERFVISAPFALLWHYQGGSFSALLKVISKPTLGVAVGIGSAMGVRYALSSGLIGPGIVKPEVYRLIWSDCIVVLRPYATKSFTIGWSLFVLNTFMAFRWIWLPVIGFFRLKNTSYFPAFKPLFFTSLLLAILSTAIVMDVAKSIGFLFPGTFFCVAAWVKRKINDAEVHNRLWKIIGALVLTPVFCVNAYLPAFWIPLPIEFTRSVVMHFWQYDMIRDFIVPLVHSDKVFLPIEHYRK